MDKQKIEQVIEALEHVRKRPRMHMLAGKHSGFNFFSGFHMGLHLMGFKPEDRPYGQQVLVARGWELSAVAPYKEMENRGMSEDAIIHELVTIEIEVWKKYLAEFDEDAEAEP